jgi:hypothetical protein
MDDNTQNDESEASTGDLLVGRGEIRAFLLSLGVRLDPYYLKSKRGWPIGTTGGDKGGSLIASKRRLARHAEKITRGQAASA